MKRKKINTTIKDCLKQRLSDEFELQSETDYAMQLYENEFKFVRFKTDINCKVIELKSISCNDYLDFINDLDSEKCKERL